MQTIQKITEKQALEMYDDMLDDCYGEVNVCGYTYTASYALEELDPIAYRCGFNDYMANLEDEYEIED